jgi:hypothetical protein
VNSRVCGEAGVGRKVARRSEGAPWSLNRSRCQAASRDLAAGDRDRTLLEYLEREQGGGEKVPLLVRENTQTVDFLSGDVQLPLALPVRDGTGNCIVQAAIQDVEFRGRNGNVPVEGKLGDGLAHVPVVARA